VRLVGTGGRIGDPSITGSDGRFVLSAPGPGSYILRVERAGYELHLSAPIPVLSGDTVEVELRLTPNPLLLDTVRVSVERTSRPPRLGEQLIRGRLIDDISEGPIAYGVMRLIQANRVVETVLTDERGAFRMTSPRAGTYRLRAERMGYWSSEADSLYLMLGDTISLDFRLSPDAVILEPISVTASTRPWADRGPMIGMDDFFDRYARYARSSYGDFLTRDDLALAERFTASMSDLLDPRRGSVGVRGCGGGGSGGGGGGTLYFLDGAPADSGVVQGIPPEGLEAVEIYRRPTIPVTLQMGGFPSCVVALWSRRSPGEFRSKHSFVKRVSIAVGILLTAYVALH
jgi:hypothetical protein